MADQTVTVEIKVKEPWVSPKRTPFEYAQQALMGQRWSPQQADDLIFLVNCGRREDASNVEGTR